MKTAYIDLIKYAIRTGHVVSVWDGEEWQVRKSTNLRTIVSAVKSVEEAELNIRKDGNKVAWALVAAYGLEPDETVIDYTMSPFTDAWQAQYDAATA